MSSGMSSRQRLSGNDRLPGAVVLARERLLARLSGVPLSGNRLVPASVCNCYLLTFSQGYHYHVCFLMVSRFRFLVMVSRFIFLVAIVSME